MKITRPGMMAYLLAVTIIALDQISKYWVLEILRLPEHGAIQVLGPFYLNFVQNEGVSFGLLRGAAWVRWALAAFSLAVSLGLAVWARKVERPLLAASIGLVMGGALGNLVDRVRFGWVVDFLDFNQIHFPWVFNVADSAINVGIALLVLEAVFPPKKAAAT